MSCINPDRPIPWNVQSKEFVFTVTGGVVFTVAAFALCYFLISAPPSPSTAQIVSYSLSSALALAGFGTFIIGMYFYNRRQREELEELLEDLQNVKPIKVEEVELQDTEVTSLAYIGKVRQELPPLFDALELFLKNFIESYHKTANENPPNLTVVSEVFKQIRGQIDEFLQKSDEVLRVAIGIVSFAAIDEKAMGELLKKTNSQVIEGLAETLSPPKPGLETQRQLVRQMLQVIAREGQANLTDGALLNRIRELREAYTDMNGAEGEGRAQKSGEYKTALIALIDHLYSSACPKISKERINTWTAHLIPPFLELWKESLFQRIQDGVWKLKEAFDDNGVLNNGGYGFAAGFVGKWGRAFVVKKKVLPLVEASPLIEDRKKALSKAIEDLVPVIVEPFYHGTLDQGHAFREKLKDLVKSQDFAIPQVAGKEWKDYIQTFADFFTKVATKLLQ